MAAKVISSGIKKEPGFLYFLDKEGDISRIKMARGRKRIDNKSAEKVANLKIKREEGFLYFIDKQGDVSKVVMTRGRKSKKQE